MKIKSPFLPSFNEKENITFFFLHHFLLDTEDFRFEAEIILMLLYDEIRLPFMKKPFVVSCDNIIFSIF